MAQEKESDRRFLQAEIDTYWIQHGGADPAEWSLAISFNNLKAMGLE